MNVKDLRYKDLRYKDLAYANLAYADLTGANLTRVNLKGANLKGANLWGGMQFQSGRSGDGYLVPTPVGWQITIGCWQHRTLDDLRDLIADRVAWPKAIGKERERRRPMLRAVLALCEAHIDLHEGLVESLAKTWLSNADGDGA